MTFTVTISGVSPDPEVYGGLVAADNYIGGLVGPGPDAWRALVTAADATSRGRILFSVTQFAEAQALRGAPSHVGGTTLHFPIATDITLADGTVIAAGTVPPAFVNGVFEFCAILAKKDSVLAAADQGGNIKIAAAGGGVMVEYFNPTSVANGTASAYPPAVQRWWAPYLAGADASGGGTGFAGNGSGCSQFTPQAGYGRWSW